jgi:polar amino acid transport system substrate-binding protein
MFAQAWQSTGELEDPGLHILPQWPAARRSLLAGLRKAVIHLGFGEARLPVLPHNGRGWCQIADICAATGVLDGITVEAYWSNLAGGCVVPTSPSSDVDERVRIRPPRPPAARNGCVARGSEHGLATYGLDVGRSPQEAVMLKPSHPLRTLVAVGATAAIVLTGCASNKEKGAGPTGTGTPTVSQNTSLTTLVPSKIKSAGKLIVGVNQPYTPNEYLDSNGKVIGFDVDLLDATAKVLGLSTDYRQADFSKISPAVTAGTYDIGMSSFTDTKERENTVDFVDYFTAGILWTSPTGKTVDPNNACGLTVSVQSTTTEQQDELPTKSKACTKAGKKPIKILAYENQDDATNAVVLGKSDAMSADSPITAYAIKQSGGKLQQAGEISEAAPYGWPMAKGSTLIQAMQKALQTLMDNGTYDQICTKWGLQAGEIKTATVNAAIS